MAPKITRNVPPRATRTPSKAPPAQEPAPEVASEAREAEARLNEAGDLKRLLGLFDQLGLKTSAGLRDRALGKKPTKK